MNSKQFLEQSRAVIDYITDYIDNVGKRKISSDVSPGFLQKSIPSEMPVKGEDFSIIFKDIEKKIMPGVVHWAHPNFYAYLPSSHAYPTILADMFSSAVAAMSFSWIAGPSMVELEVIMMDWLGRALGLPGHFLHSDKKSVGGGIMASSSSECALLTILAARMQAINFIKAKPDNSPVETDSAYLPRLVAYCSEEAHSSVKKAARVAMIKLRVLPSNEKQQLAPETLKNALQEDISKGLQPCYVLITLGTDSSGAFDNLNSIAPIVRSRPGCWLHVDAAYGGNNFICPELRDPLQGIELVDSFCVNPYKGLLMNIDSTCLWVRDAPTYCSALIVDPVYLAHHLSSSYLDHRNWSIWLSRRFRSLKVWFTFRLYGVEGLQAHVRKMLYLAREFARMVHLDKRFELCNEVMTPLVCFRLKGTDALNHELLSKINENGKILLSPSLVRSKFVIRFAVGHEGNTATSVHNAWAEVTLAADKINGESSTKQLLNSDTRLILPRKTSLMDYRSYPKKGSLQPIPERPAR